MRGPGSWPQAVFPLGPGKRACAGDPHLEATANGCVATQQQPRSKGATSFPLHLRAEEHGGTGTRCCPALRWYRYCARIIGPQGHHLTPSHSMAPSLAQSVIRKEGVRKERAPTCASDPIFPRALPFLPRDLDLVWYCLFHGLEKLGAAQLCLPCPCPWPGSDGDFDTYGTSPSSCARFKHTPLQASGLAQV